MPLRPPAGFIRPGFDPLKNPDAPTIGTATAGDTQASVAFTAPSNVGGSAISAYYAVSNPGQITGTGASSPVSVTGLTNGTAYTFSVWALNTYGPGPFSAASGSVSPAAPSRGVITSGTSGGVINVIQYLTIASTGSSTDFGDLTVGRTQTASCASSTRAVFMGGAAGGTPQNIMDYITILSTGNAVDFGDLAITMSAFGAGNNSTRGVCAGGYDGAYQNTINYITIASAGNALDYGDLTQGRTFVSAVCSPTRTIWGSGNSGANQNRIDYVTTSTTGNATDFGDMTGPLYGTSGCSSATRGVFSGGTNNPDGNTTSTNVIQYITMASTGNSIDFGDMVGNRTQSASVSSPILGCLASGYNGVTFANNSIDSITIASTGNATDFGDLVAGGYNASGTSNGNGGLQ